MSNNDYIHTYFLTNSANVKAFLEELVNTHDLGILFGKNDNFTNAVSVLVRPNEEKEFGEIAKSYRWAQKPVRIPAILLMQACKDLIHGRKDRADFKGTNPEHYILECFPQHRPLEALQKEPQPKASWQSGVSASKKDKIFKTTAENRAVLDGIQSLYVDDVILKGGDIAIKTQDTDVILTFKFTETPLDKEVLGALKQHAGTVSDITNTQGKG